jgi:uncharacterized protein YecT (DUF1311 family)
MRTLLPLLVLLVLSFPAKAQYKGPAVEACRSFAVKEAEREGLAKQEVLILQDGALLMERFDRKLGNQRVSSILTGNGAVVLPESPSAELSFICLLADEKRPVFFNWLPRYNVSALTQCTRAKAMRENTRECLEFLLRVVETDLTQVYSERFQEAHAKSEEAVERYRKSNDEWKQYRDAECLRRAQHAPQGVAPEDVQLACWIDMTRQRGRDMR